MPIRPRQLGFTIIELMVTMTILGLMLFLVNQLFNDTSVAVQTSVQTSKTIAQSRSINEQLSQDAQAMVGPGELTDNPGYIVIIQQRIPDAKLLDPQLLSEVEVTELRTDQIVFIREGEGLKSMTPATADGYGTNFVGQPGDRAKVWLGHALRTQPDGQPRAGATLGSDNATLDRIGNNWILGRQAMLFNPTNASTGIKLNVAAGGFTYANNGYFASPVTGTFASYAGPNRTYMGLTDITFQNYSPATTPGSLLNHLTNGTPDSVTTGSDDDDYINTAYRIANQRLRVNTAPDADDTNYAAWSIAQSHPVLAQGCSEIIIDFAADLNGNGRVDREFGGGTDNAGAIYWYDTLRRNPIRPTATFNWARDANGIQPLVMNTANQNIFVFRVDDATAHPGPIGTPQNNSSWPYLIRIRYRLHDTRGRLQGNYTAALTDGLDNDGDGAVDEAGEDRISGRWFERIISVPRP